MEPEPAPVTEEAAPSDAAPEPEPIETPPDAADADIFGAQHLVVQYRGAKRAPSTVTRTREEALARAKQAAAAARTPGAKFEDIAASYSDEPGAAARGGDLGRFRRGSMVKPFERAVESLKVGEISDVVETDFGFHVIKRTQ